MFVTLLNMNILIRFAMRFYNLQEFQNLLKISGKLFTADCLRLKREPRPVRAKGGFAANGRKEQEGHMRQKGGAINATDKRPTAGVHDSLRRRICAHVKREAKPPARSSRVTRVAFTGNTAPIILPSSLINLQSRAH